MCSSTHACDIYSLFSLCHRSKNNNKKKKINFTHQWCYLEREQPPESKWSHPSVNFLQYLLFIALSSYFLPYWTMCLWNNFRAFKLQMSLPGTRPCLSCSTTSEVAFKKVGLKPPLCNPTRGENSYIVPAFIYITVSCLFWLCGTVSYCWPSVK